MDWQATGDWQGGMPGRDPGLPALLAAFEHAVPFDKGGKTDACNAGARSRRCHQVKQSPGWTVTQPKPGWHRRSTPTGRTYTQEPWGYTA